MHKILACAALGVLLVACDGGNSDADGRLSGRFVDSPVSGLSWSTDSYAGLTDTQGRFDYRHTETVSFSIGGPQGIALGRAIGAPFLTPRDLIQGAGLADRAAVNLARLLIGLDADGNPANGITIDDAARTAAAGLRLTLSDFDRDPAAFPDGDLGSFAGDQIAGRGRSLPDAATAQTHLLCSELDIESGDEPDGRCPGQPPGDGDDGDSGGGDGSGDGGDGGDGSGDGNDGGGDGGSGGGDGGSGGGDGGSGGGDGGGDGGGAMDPPEAGIRSIYAPANGCFRLQAGGFYLTENAEADAYVTTAESLTARPFYFKATDLGTYLLLSGYQREPGEIGTKRLLGLSDQFGEFLDEAGNFVGEAGILVHAIGDMADFFVDVAAPNDDTIQSGGDALMYLGRVIAEPNIETTLALVGRANDLAVWQLVDLGENRFAIASAVSGQRLTLTEAGAGLTAADSESEGTRFALEPAQGCDAYPEVDVNATVAEGGPAITMSQAPLFADEIAAGQITGEEIFGFVDTHAHISAYEFIGGRINYGDPFHKFGIDHALEDCEENHGPDGSMGFVEIVTSSSTNGPHETQGWPDFDFWPRNNSLQHHQSYYRWIERSFLAGQKILVNHLVHNEILCQLNPQKERDCDAVPAIELQARLMHEMQDYIDAQSGGPGRGWFRIVRSPERAREVIADGKMAVILGLEMSKPLNCGEFLDSPECTIGEVRERLDDLQRLGGVSMFPVHKFDNAFGGHLLDLGSPVGIAGVLYAGNFSETGHPIEYEECPEQYSGDETDQNERDLSPLGIIDQLLFHLDYVGTAFPSSPEEFAPFDPRSGTEHLCNRRGLTPLGEMLVDELMLRGMLIETDHISRKAAARILDITAPLGYPVINSHGGWGGPNSLRDRIAAAGGSSHSFASGSRNGWVDNLRRDGGRPRAAQYTVGGFGGTGFATDVNGIASLPGKSDPEPADGFYPFSSVDGRVQFDVQKTGDREFSIFAGRGVAHYGLYPDLIADMQYNSDKPVEEVDEALKQLFSSAEAYLRLWERARAVSAALQ